MSELVTVLTKCLSAPCVKLHICDNCGSSWPRSKHRKDMERWPEHLRDKMDTGEDGKDQVRQKSEHWRKRDALEMRCCYLCGSSAHIKKDCQLYRSPAGSSKVFFLFKRYLISLLAIVELAVLFPFPFPCTKTIKL